MSVRIAAGSFAVQASLLYVSPTQINAILPSDVPEGTYLFTVVAGTRETGGVNITGASGGFTAFTQGARGFGPAVIQQYDDTGRPALNLFSAPAAPETIVTLWGTGMGPLPAGSDGDAPTAANLRNDISVYVDGIGATPLYAGRAPGYPGVDQINFKLPADVRPRCYVPIAISTAGRFTFCGRLPGDDFCSNTRFLSANQPAVATGMKRSAPKKRRGRKSMFYRRASGSLDEK